MRKMFIAERDRQKPVVQGVRKCETSYEYMVRDNSACACNDKMRRSSPSIGLFLSFVGIAY